MGKKGILNMDRKQLAVEFLPRALWILEGLCLYLGVRYYSLTFSTSASSTVVAYVLIIVGAAFLFWVFGTFMVMARSLVTKELMTVGPYKLVRHPMYTAIYIILVGVGLLLASYAWFAVLILFIPFWYLVARAEEWQMTSLYGEKYLAYKNKTRMFL